MSSELCIPSKAERSVLFERCEYSGHGSLELGDVEAAVAAWCPDLGDTCTATVVHRAYVAADASCADRIGRRQFRQFWVYLHFFHSKRVAFQRIKARGDIMMTEFPACCDALGLGQETPPTEYASASRLDAGGSGASLSFDAFCCWAARAHGGALGLRGSDERQSLGSGESGQVSPWCLYD